MAETQQTLAQKLADIAAKKKPTESKSDTGEKTLSQKLMDINDKAFEQRKKMYMNNKIGEAKAKRGPSNAGRITGLQTLKTI